MFKNQARGTEDKKPKEFVNDLLRSDFHKRFMVSVRLRCYTKDMTDSTTEQICTMNSHLHLWTQLHHVGVEKQEPDVTAHYQQDRQDPPSPVSKRQDRLSGA